MDYTFLLLKTYELYKEDWCQERGYNLKDINDEFGINGEIFVCLNEFEECEFQDKKYINYLLNKK